MPDKTAMGRSMNGQRAALCVTSGMDLQARSVSLYKRQGSNIETCLPVMDAK